MHVQSSLGLTTAILDAVQQDRKSSTERDPAVQAPTLDLVFLTGA